MGRAKSTRPFPDFAMHAGGWLRVRSSHWARRFVTSPMVRWTWAELGEPEFEHVLTDYRPADLETVREMISGRYLLAAKLVDTQGVSPFAAELGTPEWQDELQSFSWLRHFRDARAPNERRFARTLALDWIGRNRQYTPRNWSILLTAQRVMNWLRHLDLLLEDTPNAQPGSNQSHSSQSRAISRLLNQQVQSLRVRVPLSSQPLEALMGRIALVGAALAQPDSAKGAETISQRLDQLHALLDAQFDADGLHLSRNPAHQVMILGELITLRNALSRRQSVERLGTLIARMHSTLAQLTLGTGELAYVNGCGQLQVDLLYALHAQGNASLEGNMVLSGYGVLREKDAVVIADAGAVPPPAFSRQAHAGALGFEFSHGNELILGNCGPAPASLHRQDHLFRLAAAHSAPEIAGRASARLIKRGAMAGALLSKGGAAKVQLLTGDPALYLSSSGHLAPRRGVTAERWLSLISNGDTLVGKDRFTLTFANKFGGGKIRPQKAVDPEPPLIVRFHLGPGVQAERTGPDNLIHLHLPSGGHWTFLWEGAQAQIEQSVRHSVNLGFHHTRQIVLETPLSEEVELAWVLTRVI